MLSDSHILYKHLIRNQFIYSGPYSFFGHFNKTFNYNTNKIINKNVDIQYNNCYILYNLLKSFMNHLIETLYDDNIDNIININFKNNYIQIKFNSVNKLKNINRLYSINYIDDTNYLTYDYTSDFWMLSIIIFSKKFKITINDLDKQYNQYFKNNMLVNKISIKQHFFNKNTKSTKIKFKIDLNKFCIKNIPIEMIELVIYNLIQLHKTNLKIIFNNKIVNK